MRETTSQPVDEQHSAFLIDGGHFPPTLVGRALAFAQTTSNVTIRRVYANWGVESIPQPWREVMAQHALWYQSEKSPANDHTAVVMTLVIDALKLLHRDGIRSFVLVADERDYAPLIRELLREQCTILGIGTTEMPPAQQYPTFPYALFDTHGLNSRADQHESREPSSSS